MFSVLKLITKYLNEQRLLSCIVSAVFYALKHLPL